METQRRYMSPYLCDHCRDFRVVARYASMRRADTVPCEKCGLMSEEEYRDWRRKRWGELQVPPSICELDLTEDELKLYKTWRIESPESTKITVLAWIEGHRYHPKDDPEFLAGAREDFKKWKHGRKPRN